MKDKDSLILENLYSQVLLETRNTLFLKELDPLLKKWNETQSKIKGTIPSYRHDEHGEPSDSPDAGQIIDKKDLPVYYQNTKNIPTKYQTEHPSSRRVYYAQTDNEIQLEKELLRIYQKYADQEYFNRDVKFCHDFGYWATASAGGPNGIPNREEYEEFYLKNENKIYKDVLSCHGRDITRTNLRNIGHYGMIVKGRVLFASVGDLASQTFRQSSQSIRDYFKNSGVPKRASIGHVHSLEDDNHSLKLKQRMLEIRKKPPMTEEEKNEFLNKTVLDKNDSSSIEEALLGNWHIDGWFFSRFDENSYPAPYYFWKKAYENKIQKPVYLIEVNTENKPKLIDLKKYFDK